MSKGKSTTTTTTDPTQMAIYEDLYGKAQGIAQQPFIPYTGARVAGFNPDQLQGFDATRNMFNQSMGFNPRNQLNNLANMSAPSVNLPFGYSQPQQPSPIFQPMPITGGSGGRPTPPPSFGGIGGGGPVFTSPDFGRRAPTISEPRQGSGLLGGGSQPITTRIGRNGQEIPVYGFSNNVNNSMNIGGPARLPESQLPEAERLFNSQLETPFIENAAIRQPGVTVPRPDPIRRPMPVPGPSLLNPPQSPTGQITAPIMQQASSIRPVERFEAANISPIDLYSGASVNRGDVRDVTPRSLLDTNLGAYQNPFQSQVIDNTLGDLNRARQLQIQSDQDAAIGRGAFGGSRSALLESETNRNFAEQAAKTSGNLRAQGFDRATSLAGQDIGRQFDADRYMSDADRAIAMQNATFGQQAGLAKQGLLGDVSLNQARLDQQAGMAGADAYNRAGSQQAQLDASRFAANQNASNQMNMGMFDAANRAAFMQPELEMRNRQFQAGLLNNQLSDQYRNLGLLSGIGGQQQGLQQRGMDAGYNEFLRAIGYGPQQLGLLAQGVSALPTQTNTTSSNRPGTLSQIGSVASIFGGLGYSPFS